MDMKSEPARIIGLITGGVTAVIALLVAFGVDLTDEQQAAILGLVAAVAPVVAGYIIRNKVYAPDTVAKIRRSAYDPMRPETWQDPPPPEPIRGMVPFKDTIPAR